MRIQNSASEFFIFLLAVFIPNVSFTCLLIPFDEGMSHKF
jgi:hypothetical protein